MSGSQCEDEIWSVSWPILGCRLKSIADRRLPVSRELLTFDGQLTMFSVPGSEQWDSRRIQNYRMKTCSGSSVNRKSSIGHV